ncbi:MAG: sugar phosphate nucleotidyltransferase [Candidatus Heimdallarchaeota archaeon]|nr:sugar phosphate nucleotidyltransferase [Candidatus Heimdallarchaeota archaeon]
MKAIILAGGFGTRMYPLTDNIPKCMLPIAGIPLLEWSIELIKQELKIFEIIIVVGYKKEVIQNYFGNGEKFGVNITYCSQDLEKDKGLAAALLTTRNLIKSDFVLILGDNLYKGPFRDIIEYHNQHQPDATIQMETVENPSRYGVIINDSNDIEKVIKLIEKPKNPPTHNVITGFYILNPKIFSVIDLINPSERGELEITDALDYLARTGDVRSVIIGGWRKDIGYPIDLIEASNWILSNANEDVILSPIDENVTIISPVFIGKGCEIKNSIIGPYVSISSNTTIIDSSIRNSIILDNAYIKGINVVDQVLDDYNNININFYEPVKTK